MFKKILIILISIILINAGTKNVNCEESVNSAALKLSNYYVMKSDFKRARIVVKNAIAKDPENDSLWLSYENIIRQEQNLEKKDGNITTLSAPYNEVIKNEDGEIAESPQIIKIAEEMAKEPLPRDYYYSDFSHEDLNGDFSVILGKNLEVISGEGIKFFEKKGGDLYLSFDLKKFPRGANLIFNHKITKKIGKSSLRFVPVKIKINDKDLVIRKTRVKTGGCENSWKCTNLLKRGTNIIHINIPEFSRDYILSTVRLNKEL